MLYVWLLILVLLNAVWLVLVLFGLPGNCRHCGPGAAGRVDRVLRRDGRRPEIGGELGRLNCRTVWGAARRGRRNDDAPVPLVGTVVGTCLGAGLSVWAIEVSRGEHPDLSLRRGVGAGAGKFLGIVGKFALGIGIWLIITVAAFWP